MMFRNYFRSTLRILSKEKLYVIVNAFGLSVGLAASLLIFSWVRNEVSYDRFYPDVDRLYRVVTDWEQQSEPGMATAYPMIRTRLLSQLPEVESSARMFNQGFLGSKTRVAFGDKVLTNLRYYYGDPEVLALFGYRVIAGDRVAPLARPNTVVLTRSTALKIFGSVDPIGRTLRVGARKDMEVTAIIEDIPENAHTHFDVLATMLSHPWIKGAENNVWSGIVFHTYVKLKPLARPQATETNLANLLKDFPDDPDHIGRSLRLRLQPVADIHLGSNRDMEAEANGNASYVFLFITIALLVLVVAMINYVNLATARHTQRYREVGVRKVLGAQRGQLVMQFMTESLMVMMIALAGSLLLAEGARPLLEGISGKSLFEGSFLQPTVLLIMAVAAGITGLITGILPAFALASFQPASLFRPSSGGNQRGWNGRKVLIITQFTVSIMLTICTAIMYRQMNYLQEAKLGYVKDHVVILDISLPGPRESLQALKNTFASLPGVLGVTAASQLPTDIHTGENIDVSPSQTLGVNSVSVDQDFFNVMSIPLKESAVEVITLVPNDTVNRFVLNRSALAALGWTDDQALGHLISIRHGNQKPGPVLGIAEDFHFQSLHHGIAPLAIEFNPDDFQYMLVKISPDNLQATLDALADSWNKLAGGIPFDYQFLDEQYNHLYEAEQQSSGLFLTFSVIAVSISLLGLFGLASFTLERRTKEMGIRKILGADAWQVAKLVTRDFILVMTVAVAIAIPLGYWFRENWLSQFAFRTDIGMGVFVLCGLLNMALALLTLLYHTSRISRVNPVETLRYE